MSNRERILEAALRIYREYGFRGTTTRRIAQEAGVNEVTLFRQFGSKAALIEAAVRDHSVITQAEILPDTPHDPQTELTQWCEGQLKRLWQSRDLLRKFMSDIQQHPALLAHIRNAPAFSSAGITAYIRHLKEAGVADRDLNLEAAVQMIRGTLFSDAMGRDMFPQTVPDATEAPALYAALFLRAIGSSSKAHPSTPSSHPRKHS